MTPSKGLRGKRAAVLGAGRQGTCAAYDMLRWGGAREVVLADSCGGATRAAARRLRRLLPEARVLELEVDAADAGALARSMEGASAAVCALPFRLGPAAASAAVRAECHLADLGGNERASARILALDEDARRRGVCLVPDTGLAPGLANTLAAAGIARVAETRAVRIWCGGLPQRPIPPFDYRLVFSIEGLLNEYAGEALYLRGGRETRVPALSELEQLELPGAGPVEAFATSGGTSTAPRSWSGRLDRYEYKTVRYRGHCARLRALSDAGLLSEEAIELAPGTSVIPRALLAALLNDKLAHPDVPDLVVLRVEVVGASGDPHESMTYDLLDREDSVTGFTAMERTTAFPAAIVAEMAAAGEIEPGSGRVETDVPPEAFLARLALRPLELRTRAVTAARGADQDEEE